MAKFSAFLKSLGYITSAAKVNKLVDELKKRDIRLTDELNARISGRIIGREAVACWISRKNSELKTINTIYKHKMPSQHIPVLKKPKRNAMQQKQKLRKKIEVKTGRQLNPNASSYWSETLKENLKRKYSGYEYGLSDW